MDMHESFGPWVKAIDPTGDGTALENRWNGTLATINALDVDLIDHLTQRHFGLNGETDAGAHVFEGAHKAANQFLDVGEADNELRVLAAAALATVLDADTEWSDHVALAVLSAEFQDHRHAETPVNLVSRAKRRASISGEAIRQRGVLKPAATLSTGKPDFTSKLTAEAGLEDDETARAVLSDIATKFSTEFTRARRESRMGVQALIDHIDMKDEELELLWWVFNEFSETRETPFKSLKPAERSLVAGIEFAGKLKRVPGPISAPALLARMGLNSKTVHSVTQAVDACHFDWIATCNLDHSGVLTPLHSAMAERQRVGKSGDWSSAWSAISKCDPNLELSQALLAQQVYLEGSYLKSRGESQ